MSRIIAYVHLAPGVEADVRNIETFGDNPRLGTLYRDHVTLRS